MPNPPPAPFSRLQAALAAAAGPLVVAHRGDSRHCAENTLAAFRAAAAAAVPMQEFDVQQTRDGQLVCIHDEGLDRTTDAAQRLGPGALVAHTDLAQLLRLDAGSWRGPEHAGERIPTLAQALAVMLPAGIPLIEHKSGTAAHYVAALANCQDAVIVQSFDWQFVAAMRAAAPKSALAVLGPTATHRTLDDAALAAAVALGAGMVHWRDRDVTAAAVRAAHARGLLVCSYTTDHELGWAGGRSLGIDAMCTNDPCAMQRWRQDRAHWAS